MVHQRIGEVGYAIQSGVGVPASNPAYAMGVQEGFPAVVEDIGVSIPAAHLLVAQDVRKGLTRWETGTTTWAYAASLGPLLKGALGAETVTGGGPYDHKFTPGTTDRYLSLFSAKGSLYERWVDGLVESLILDWMSSRRVSATLQASGLDASILGSAYTPGLREAEGPNEEVFHYIGATMKVDWADTPATTVLTNIEDGAIRFTRPLTIVATADAQGAMSINRGPLEIEGAFSLIVDDLDGYRTTFMGSATGSAPSPIVVYGSVDFTFVAGAGRTLRVEVPRAAFRWESPQPRQRAGALMTDVHFIAARPSSGDFATATLTNGVSGSY